MVLPFLLVWNYFPSNSMRCMYFVLLLLYFVKFKTRTKKCFFLYSTGICRHFLTYKLRAVIQICLIEIFSSIFLYWPFLFLSINKTPLNIFTSKSVYPKLTPNLHPLTRFAPNSLIERPSHVSRADTVTTSSRHPVHAGSSIWLTDLSLDFLFSFIS